MKKLSIILLICVSFQSYANVSDIITNDGYSRINIIRKSVDGTDYVKFEYCQAGAICKFLGKKEFYSLNELEDQRLQEKLEIAYAGGADVGIAIISALAVALAWGFTLGGIPEIPALVGLVVGPPVVGHYIDQVNPYEQYLQMKTLSESVLCDNLITLDREIDLYEFVSRLKFVLNKIDIAE